MWRVQGFVGRGERNVIDTGETPPFSQCCAVSSRRLIVTKYNVYLILFCIVISVTSANFLSPLYSVGAIDAVNRFILVEVESAPVTDPLSQLLSFNGAKLPRD